MTALGLARLQFGITTIYHFLFVPLTIGLAFLLAVIETFYVVTKDPDYKRLLDFFGPVFLINFAVGVVTGILQEFQFGMNWSSYARYVGDVFGAPLAVEALLAFFLESTFLGLWIFGWDRLSPRLHALSMWLVAAGTTISAYWILTANAFMQEPVGYAVRHGHAEMTSFGALLTNPQLWVEFPHVFLGALATGAFVMIAISAYFLLRRRHVAVFDKSFRLAMALGLVSSVLVAVVGHDQAQHVVATQPMKLAASEALWNTSGDHAGWTLFAVIDPKTKTNRDVIAIPDLLSILAYNSTSGSVPGIRQLEAADVARYGPGNYVPPVIPTFWSFRIMVAAGVLMVLFTARGAYDILKGRHRERRRFLKALVAAAVLPYIANTTGWIMTEVGRQPWTVYGLESTARSVSPTVSPIEVWITLVGFGTLYGAMAVAALYLVRRQMRAGLDGKASNEGQKGPVKLV